MNLNALDAQRVGNATRMLTAGAAEAIERIFGDVVAPLHRDLLDRVRHILDGDGQESLGGLLGAQLLSGCGPDLARQRLELPSNNVQVQRPIAAGTENFGEMTGLQPAEEQVGVGHRERAALAVAGGAGICARRFRPDPESCPVEPEDRPAARRHGVNTHHRHAHPYTGDDGFERPLERAGEMTDIRGRAAHVEADDLFEARHAGGRDGADHAARRSGEDAVFSLEQGCVRQAAVRLHEHGSHPRQGGRNPVDVSPQDRRQIGVDGGGVAPGHELHQRTDLVRCGDLGESRLPCEARHPRLVVRIAVSVHEDDGDGTNAVTESGGQGFARETLIQRLQFVAAGVHAAGNLRHPAIDLLREFDMKGEEAGAVLIADPQRIGETPVGYEQGRLARPLEERIGGHGRSHLDRRDIGNRNFVAGSHPKRAPDTLDCRVRVPVGVLGEQLQRRKFTVRRARHHVGEGAAPVDPKLPSGYSGVPAHVDPSPNPGFRTMVISISGGFSWVDQEVSNRAGGQAWIAGGRQGD